MRARRPAARGLVRLIDAPCVKSGAIFGVTGAYRVRKNAAALRQDTGACSHAHVAGRLTHIKNAPALRRACLPRAWPRPSPARVHISVSLCAKKHVATSGSRQALSAPRKTARPPPAAASPGICRTGRAEGRALKKEAAQSAANGLTGRAVSSIITELAGFRAGQRRWRSRVAWSSAHDWKSCIPQKGIEGSNPSFSAKDLLHFCVISPFSFCGVYGALHCSVSGNAYRTCNKHQSADGVRFPSSRARAHRCDIVCRVGRRWRWLRRPDAILPASAVLFLLMIL